MFALVAVLPVVAGCFSAAPRTPVKWLIEADIKVPVSFVSVAAPYDGVQFAVRRPDGSIAFDGYNAFASRPVALVKAAVKEETRGAKLHVRRLMLDCTTPDRRDAVCELRMEQDGREADGRGAEPTADGNYTRAFSAAFERAVKEAAGKLR